MDAATQQTHTGSGNLTIEKLAEGQIACLKFSGTLDETFEGKKLSATVKAPTLVLDLGNVVKISSFGLREWSDFMRGVEKSAKTIYLIECTPKVVDQLNMVANFAGKGIVYSFYAPYRCDYCDIDRQVLFQVDRDREPIKSMRPPEQPCETCGNEEYLDEDPATFFSYLAKQPEVDVDPEVASFLASRLGYSVSESPRRLQVEKHVDGRSTYLKLSGNLDGSFPREKIAEGLEGTIVIDVAGVGGIDPAGAAEWRGLIAMVGPFVDRLYLLGCPPAFLERLARREDLGDEVEVLSFSMPYACSTCSTTVAKAVDVSEHFEILKFATPPEMKCDDCKSQTTCVASETLLSQLPALPEPTVTGELRKFIKDAQAQQKRERILAAQPAKQAAGVPRYVTALLSMSSAAVLALIGYLIYDQQTRPEEAAATGPQQTLIDLRPDWVTSGEPASAYCSDLINRLVCVGVSSFQADLDQARDEATDAALDELASAVGLKVEADSFGAVRDFYANARRDALVALDDARGDPEQYEQALQHVRERRAAVRRMIIASGGAAIPGQPTDGHWEEYDPRAGAGDDVEAEFLSFRRFDVSVDGLRRLVQRYSEVVEVGGSRVLTVFPSMAWNHPDLESGAVVVEAGGQLGRLGVEPLDIITDVGGAPVADAAALADAIAAAGGSLSLTVISRDGEVQELGAGP